VSRKYNPPLRVRQQPTTRLGYVEEIADLQQLRPGQPEFMQFWIDQQIEELTKEMEKLKCSATQD
jgi:hypothetical protein